MPCEAPVTMTVFLLAIFRLSQFGVISHGEGREAPATEIINKAWITMLQTPTPEPTTS